MTTTMASRLMLRQRPPSFHLYSKLRRLGSVQLESGRRLTSSLASFLSSPRGGCGQEVPSDTTVDHASLVAALLTCASAGFGISRLDHGSSKEGELLAPCRNFPVRCDVEVSAPAVSASLDPPVAPPRPIVMLKRMRTVGARNMSQKYRVDWNTVLGEGAYGSVHPARIAATGEKVALKKISKRYTNTSSFRTETDALLRVYDNGGHPNISGLRDIYEDSRHYYLVMDLVSGGEMFEHLINYGSYTEADAARLMREVASALAFLHGVNVVHADLKPENMLLCSKKKSDGTIKIIDFGCAVVGQDNYHDDDKNDELYQDEEMRPKGKQVVIQSQGTTAYWPPERFAEKSHPTPAVDMWGLGIILYIMLIGLHPFDLTGMATDEEIEEQIQLDPTPPITPDLTGHLSSSAIDLVQKLMAKDPSKRMTAREMLEHPWICGEAETTTLADSAIKLAKFKDLRTKVEAGIFAVLVHHGNKDQTLSEAKPKRSGGGRNDPAPTHLMKRAFEIFDQEGKGFVSSDDLGRVVREETGSEMTDDEREEMLTATRPDTPYDEDDGGMSLSGFSQLFGRLKHKHYPRGHVIFRAGEVGDSMYFINSGKVEIQTRKGQLVSLLRHGDFFGEGSLMDEHSCRFTSAKAATPVDLIKIKREEFDRYIAASTSAKETLKRKWKARTLTYAKNLIRLQTNVKERIFHMGDVVYKEGETGKSMYRVDEREGGELDVRHGDVVMHKYYQGESFGESSLLFERPRSSTVVCSSKICKLHEMLGSDFLAVMESSPETLIALQNMCRKRLFKKAIKMFSLGKNRGLQNEDIVAAFHEADKDQTGHLSLDSVRDLMHTLDPTIPESEILALMLFIDVDEDGYCTLGDFKRLFRQFEEDS